MKANKYSPRWLLNRLNESNTEANKLMYIFEFQEEVIKCTRQLVSSGVIITSQCGRCNSKDLYDCGYFYSCNNCLNIADHKKTK